MSNKKQNSLYAWWMLFIVLFMSIAAPLNQFKVPPMIQALSNDLDISLAMAGWLMSIFSIVAIFLAIPLGLLLPKIGIKNAGIIALLSLMLGSLLGYLAHSPLELLVSRLIEGLGMCLVAIVGPAALSFWFSSEKLGSAMGIWGAWVPLGLVIMFNIAPQIGVENWRPVWLFTICYTFIALLLFIFCFRMPRNMVDSVKIKKDVLSSSNNSNKKKLKSLLRSFLLAFKIEDSKNSKEDKPTSLLSSIFHKNKLDIWLLASVFLCYNVCQMFINSFMPSFMQNNLHMSPASAGFTASLLMSMSVVSGALAGRWSDKIKSRKLPIILAMLGLICCMFFPFSLHSNMMTIYMLIVGFFIGVVPVCVFAAAPEIMGEPNNAGLGLSLVASGQNIGMFIGSGFYGILIENIGWVYTGYAVIPILLIGMLVAYKMQIR